MFTCSEFDIVKIYWNTTEWSFTANTPKNQEMPRRGSKTSETRALVLKKQRHSQIKIHEDFTPVWRFMKSIHILSACLHASPSHKELPFCRYTFLVRSYYQYLCVEYFFVHFYGPIRDIPRVSSLSPNDNLNGSTFQWTYNNWVLHCSNHG